MAGVVLVGGLSWPAGETQAVVPVSVVGTILAGPVNTINQNTRKTAELLNSLWQKELVQDPNVWGQNKDTLKKMTGEMVEYVNSGFDGSPAFVTNLQRFMRNVAAVNNREFITGSDLDGLSDAFELKVRTTLYKDLVENVEKYEPESTLDDVTQNRTQDFLDGNYKEKNYWEAWYELTQGEYNDPIKATLKTRDERNVRNVATMVNEQTQLNWSEGYLETRYCTSTTTTSTGGTERQCVNTTPHALIKTTVGHLLGVLPAEIILAGEEVNETIEPTFERLSQQIVTGQNGLLGVGASPLSNNSYGSNGNSSYLDVLLDRSPGGGGSGPDTLNNPIKDSLLAETNRLALRQRTINTVAILEQKLTDSRNAYPDCFALDLTTDLQNDKDLATAEVMISNTVIQALEVLNNDYINASSSEQINDILDIYYNIEAEGWLTTELENNNYENVYLNQAFKDRVNTFNQAIDAELYRCELENPSDTDNDSGIQP